jgi:hypothetical protein
MHYRLNAETGYINFSPVGFRLAARDFLRCATAFKPPKFSIVPFFLHCRAIELGLKALHLETRNQREVKKDFGHDLVASYNALPAGQRTLADEDAALLEQTNELYMRKAFEYVQPGDAANGYSTFPDPDLLAHLASKFASERHLIHRCS